MLLFRRTQVVVLLAALFASGPTAVVAQSVTVTVNGQAMYLNPGPIERSGRVFVPLRGIFERLGAAVVYVSGTINATKGSTTVSLRIGSTQATINGQAQILDVAPFIVGASTYVPLRFVAQSLGANVGYDGSTRVVAIVTASGPGQVPPRPYPPAPPPRPNPPPNSVVNLRARQPAPDSLVNDRFIVIAAEFTHRVAAGSVRVRLDGNNITNRSGVSQTGFSYKPPAPLDFGSHTVRVDGRDVAGAPFDRAWTFSVRRSGPAPIGLTINQPAPDTEVGRTFVVAGITAPYARVSVTAGATPSLNGQFAGTTTAGGQGNFRIKVTLTTLMGQQSVRVRITATDPSTSQSTSTTLQLRLSN
ncbi:MAG: copper amine oxidase N-terminal domain-containing protein [Candidatus Cybelea sp.]